MCRFHTHIETKAIGSIDQTLEAKYAMNCNPYEKGRLKLVRMVTNQKTSHINAVHFQRVLFIRSYDIKKKKRKTNDIRKRIIQWFTEYHNGSYNCKSESLVHRVSILPNSKRKVLESHIRTTKKWSDGVRARLTYRY